MHTKYIVEAGQDLQEAKKALIMIHGRGADAQDILGLSQYFDLKDYALLAPQATNNTWYPYSFLAPPAQNEPWLSSALALLKEMVADIQASGIANEQIYFLGFSQGACLTLEFITRNATRYGGAVAFTGGLIGDVINTGNYAGDFGGTPVFIGTSDPDPHVPVQRVQESADLLTTMNAQVTTKVYPNMGHTINQDEIVQAQQILH
jgi:phospholipase/carboxylesterase